VPKVLSEGVEMTETPDTWATLHQLLPRPVYDELMIGLRRIAVCNGISADAFTSDDKFRQSIGARVQVFEILSILLRETGDAGLRQ